MDKAIIHKLHTLGFRSHYKGFNYIVRCIELGLHKDKKDINLELFYRKIAEEFHVPKGQVCCCIYEILKYYWKSYEDKILRLHIDSIIEKRPTCKEFICILCQICQ